MRINIEAPLSPLLLAEALIQLKASKEPSELVFGPGVFHLQDIVQITTPFIAHDEGCGKVEQKEIHLLLEHLHDLTIRGSLGAEGQLQTELVAVNNGVSQALQPSLLWAEHCRNLKICDCIFRREPSTVINGRIEAVEPGRVLASLEGTSLQDVPLYCMNVLQQDRTLRTPSISYGFGDVPVARRMADGRYRIDDAQVASMVSEGELLSAHQAGKTDFLLFFGRCDHLQLENIWIQNANSMAILTQQCSSITARNVHIRPKRGSSFTASRDGWKVYRCSGELDMYGCHIEGVRMDGQNVHSNYLQVETVLDAYSLLCTCRYAPLSLEDGSEIAFGSIPPYTIRTLRLWELVASEFRLPVQEKSQGSAPVVGRENRINTYRLVFNSPINEIADTGSLLRALCWEVGSYHCSHSVFSNIAGAGIMLRCSNARIEHNAFLHCMNAGILVGSELATHQECSHVTDLVIRENIFEGNGFRPRYGIYGCGGVSIHSQGFTDSCNQRISILGNVFRDTETALDLSCASTVQIAGNTFEHVGKRLRIDESSCSGIEYKEYEHAH